jgi:lycopene cyclase domain-containing protein
LLAIDVRYRLAFWHDAVKTAKVIVVAMGAFIAWDIIGIRLGIFYKGTSTFMLPFVIAPEFPLEELFFLFLLTYVTLLIHLGAQRWQHTL